MSLSFFTAAKLFELPAGHAGLATATSASAWINAMLLLRRLRRDGAYQPSPGWRMFGLRLLLANLGLAVVVLVLSGPLQYWLDLAPVAKWLSVLKIIGAAGGTYFAVLWLSGVRPADFRRAASMEGTR